MRAATYPAALGSRGGQATGLPISCAMASPMIWACGGVVHAAPGAVTGEPFGDVDLLFEVVAEGEVKERSVAVWASHPMFVGPPPPS